jgi:hypothetical protein
VTRLASRITRGDAPLGAIADALAELAATIDATRVVVAVDDQHLGRQVFTSARAPLGVEPIGLFGAAGTWTEPVGKLGADEAELVAATVGVALGTLPYAAPVPAPMPTGAESPGSALDGAVARARTHGWSFTLALVRFDDGNSSPERVASVQSGLRAGDTALAAAAGTIAVTLPAVHDDVAAAILAAAVRAGVLPRCNFGLVRCPEEARDTASLLRLAAQRLADATAARYPGSALE